MSTMGAVDWAASRMGLANLATDQDPVAARTPQSQQMLSVLTMIDDVYGGTRTMRSASTRWLPMESKEKALRYSIRLERTFLYNMFARTVHVLAGKPFARSISIVDGSIDDEIKDWLEDIDRQGNHIDVFAHNLMKMIVKDGLTGILVDMPKRPVTNFVSIYDAKQQGLRPYFCAVDVRNILGWRSTVINGKPVLTQLRLQECVTVPDGPYGEQLLERVRVFNLGTDLVGLSGKSQVSYEVWEKRSQNNQSRYVQVDQGALQGISQIPFVIIYGTEVSGYMSAKPPLEDLAWLNIEHWQSSSDQKNVLHVARVPILFAAGFPEMDPEDPKKKTPLEVSPNSLVCSADPNAKLGYVEHTGAAVGAGQTDLEDIENRAALMGLQLLKKKAVTTTATEERQDGLNEDSELSAMARNLEDGLEQGLVLAATWAGKDPEKAGELNVFKDFSIDARKVEELTLLLQARQAKEITQKTFLDSLVKFGVLASDFNVDEEIDATINEVPKGLGLEGMDPSNPAPPRPRPPVPPVQ